MFWIGGRLREVAAHRVSTVFRKGRFLTLENALLTHILALHCFQLLGATRAPINNEHFDIHKAEWNPPPPPPPPAGASPGPPPKSLPLPNCVKRKQYRFMFSWWEPKKRGHVEPSWTKQWTLPTQHGKGCGELTCFDNLLSDPRISISRGEMKSCHFFCWARINKGSILQQIFAYNTITWPTGKHEGCHSLIIGSICISLGIFEKMLYNFSVSKRSGFV